MINSTISFRVIRGEIYMVDLGTQNGSKQGGVRPCIIVSNNKNNTYSPTVNVVPLTSKSKNNIPVHVNIGKNCGLKQESIALIEQITTIDKTQIKNKVGECTLEILREVNKAIKIQSESENIIEVNEFVTDFTQKHKINNEKFIDALKKSLSQYCQQKEIIFV